MAAPSRPELDPALIAADAAAWDDLRAFLAVAVHGSMNRAARALGESQPTIARRLARLEKALGVALAARGVNAITLTGAGRAVLGAAAPMAAAAGEAAAAARLHRRDPGAPVRITTTTSLALFLSRHLPALRAASAPRDILLVPSRRLFDIAAGEADLALRMRAPPDDPRLLVRKLGVVVFAIYARADAREAPLLTPPDLGPTSRQFALARRVLADRPAGPEI
ncbi:MAG: LysR family transcriptional regulator, partial [Methylobacteriaceae bacterium]|nr:LysR family transcriptional regulator [Methylobacteriaceae bacterium]